MKHYWNVVMHITHSTPGVKLLYKYTLPFFFSLGFVSCKKNKYLSENVSKCFKLKPKSSVEKLSDSISFYTMHAILPTNTKILSLAIFSFLGIFSFSHKIFNYFAIVQPKNCDLYKVDQSTCKLRQRITSRSAYLRYI